MRKFIVIIIVTLFPTVLWAHYSIHSVSGKVKVESGGKRQECVKGMSLKASDYLIIPAGGKVKIYNDLDKVIYSSVSDGKISVTRLMIDAREAASDNRGNVTSRLRFGKKSSPGNKRLYVEKGMVKRSLGRHDPEGEKIVADPGAIARHIASRLFSTEEFKPDILPAKVEKETPSEGGMRFKVWNTLDFPIYFNIVKVVRNASKTRISISEVGQPAGLYVLLPGQTLSREHFVPVPENEKHLMVMTHSQFDVDDMIEQLETYLNEGEIPTAGTESVMPLYLTDL